MGDLQQYSDDNLILDLFPKGKLFRIYIDANVGKIRVIAANSDLFAQLRNAFATNNPTAFFSSQYGFNVDPKVWQINKFGYLTNGPGLIFDVLSWIKDYCGSLDVVDISNGCKQYIKDYLVPLKGMFSQDCALANISDDSNRNAELKLDGKQQYEYRDYQKNAIKSLLCKGYGRGLIELPTGSGKSFVIANFIWNINKQVDHNYRYLILVPNKQLVEQFYADLLDYGYNKSQVTKFTAGLKKFDAFNDDAMIVIANRQYLFKNKDKLPKIDALIADEVHSCCADSTSDYINSLDCRIKVGCSGTIPRDSINKWKLKAMFGMICYVEDITALQKQHYISDLKITTLEIKDNYVDAHRELLFNTKPLMTYTQNDAIDTGIFFNDAFNQEREYINTNYMKLYTPVLKYLNGLDENVLVLFDKIEIGKNIFTLAKTLIADKTSYYVDGSIAVSDREAIRAKFEQSGNNILFAQSATFSTGINIKRLNHICFAFQSKGFSRVLQSIGRSLRLHKSKSHSHLVDVCFKFKYGVKQYKERLAIYKKSYGIAKPHETLTFEV